MCDFLSFFFLGVSSFQKAENNSGIRKSRLSVKTVKIPGNLEGFSAVNNFCQCNKMNAVKQTVKSVVALLTVACRRDMSS